MDNRSKNICIPEISPEAAKTEYNTEKIGRRGNE